MISFMYSVYDVKAQAYMLPFFQATDALAIRSFENAVNKEGHAFNMNPEDYRLALIGQFDDETALVTSQDAHILIHGLQASNKSAIKEVPRETMEKTA